MSEPRQAGPQIHSKTRSGTHAIVLLIVWAISIGYTETHLKNGWVPHDEGTLGLSAERVLGGELPHRDFDDYTGGLTFVHAMAFRAFGVDSGSMRIVLFAFFIPWVPVVFYVASRFCSAYSAGAVTLLSVAWSVPNYPGPLPSWYNLFFATFGVAALLRYLEKGMRGWIFVAGLCAGLSFLAKVTGAYFVAGTLLFFVFREQTITRGQNRRQSVGARLYSVTVAFWLGVFLMLLFRMIYQVPGIRGLIFFVLPSCFLVLLLLVREFSGIVGQNRERFAALLGMCVPFAAGIAIPLAIFSVPFVASGAFRELIHGLIALPARNIQFAVFAPENAAAMATTIPFILPIVLAHEFGKLGRVICGIIVCLYGCVVLMFAPKSLLTYGLGWSSLANAIPLVILGGVAILWRERGQQGLSVIRQQQVMLLMCVTALCSLVQFPFGAPVYFFYIAPMVILTATALFASMDRPPRFALSALAGFYLLFAALPGTTYEKGLRHAPGAKVERLTLDRAGGLVVDSHDAQLYDAMIPLVRAHAVGNFIYAAPDCPEVYFLSGLNSPSRHYFEFAEDPHDYTKRTLEALEKKRASAPCRTTRAKSSPPAFSENGRTCARERTEKIGVFLLRR